uniref:Cyclin-dependent kinase 2 homolog n=2 Tax=Aureoumbra lagunensis TaxID=44058 RepID=A0A7S3K564_9STRA
MQYENHSDFEQNRHDMTHQVSTRWYRAPELLFGARRYSQAIDLWGVGVVLAELIANLPLFPGASDLDQLIRIFRLRGSPTTERWPSAVNLPDFDKIHFPDTPPTPLNIEKGLTKAPTHTVQLLDALLQLEPTKRPTALTAFSFHFFQLAPPASDPFIIKILIDRRRTQQQKMKKSSSTDD